MAPRSTPLPLTFYIFMTLTLYVDASKGEFVSGVGYVIEGETQVSGKRVLDDRYTSMEAEFYALVEGLRVASIESSSIESCEAYSDCEPLVRKMCGDESIRDDWQDYKTSFDWLSGKFDEFELNHCPRELNEDAHQLAREALFEGREA